MARKQRTTPLATWRDRSGLTLEAAAALVGCSIPHLSSVERGRRPPSLDLAERIEKITGVRMTSRMVTNPDR